MIDAFLHVLGPAGTFCVPTIVYAAQGPRPPFDVQRTPSEVGRITETARLRAEARRSNNPTHSVAAYRGAGGGDNDRARPREGTTEPLGGAGLRPRKPVAAILRPRRHPRAPGCRLGGQHDVPLPAVRLHRAVLERVLGRAPFSLLRPNTHGTRPGGSRHRAHTTAGFGDGDVCGVETDGGHGQRGAGGKPGPVFQGCREG